MHYWPLILTGTFGVASIFAAEHLARRQKISNETSRKIVHIAHALIIGSWPFFTTYGVVITAELISLGIVFLARAFKLFQPFREVKRSSWGEFFFPVAVIIIALAQPSKWLFLAAILHFGLADSFAAIIGTKTKSGHYKLFGNGKSVVGTGVFWIISFGIVTWFMYGQVQVDSALWPMLLLVPTLTTFVENVSPWGSDNLTVPLAAYGLLALLV